MRFGRGPARKRREARHQIMEKVGLEKDEHLHQDYEYASGIVERVGSVPLWLKAVYVSLIVWSIYYIIRYWSG